MLQIKVAKAGSGLVAGARGANDEICSLSAARGEMMPCSELGLLCYEFFGVFRINLLTHLLSSIHLS